MFLYMLGVFVYFGYRIIRGKRKVPEVLFACAYITGVEVLFRMTKAFIFYETGKYAIIGFTLIGMFFVGFKRSALSYIIYILLLLPAVLVSLNVIAFDANFRNTVLFNLSGPLCLSFAAIFFYGRTISLQTLLKGLDYVVYPLISMVVYITLYTPNVQEIITGTASNAALSGGYGPNQVATVLGLGIFILYSRLLIPYKNLWVQGVFMFFMLAMTYRALLTFSRGGVLVAVIMAAVFTIVLYGSTSIKVKTKITLKLGLVLVAMLLVWSYTLVQTRGLIENRYANEDALGREKEDLTTGRVDLLQVEMEAFKQNPIFGIGIGQGKFQFREEMGIQSASHNEVTRLLSEHGLFGLLALLLLIAIPLITKLLGRKNVYFYPFFIFWGLTIAHSSMRIAAPAFLYALCLLNLNYGKERKTKPAIHRE